MSARLTQTPSGGSEQAKIRQVQGPNIQVARSLRPRRLTDTTAHVSQPTGSSGFIHNERQGATQCESHQ